MQQDDVKILHTSGTQSRGRVFADLNENQAQALTQHADFFESDAHQQKIDQVRDIVENFFTVCKSIYVNHRANRGKPFTVVKVEKPQFPRMKQHEIDVCYREPLKALGVEIVFSKASNSYLFRIA
jgi:hypothetical protein